MATLKYTVDGTAWTKIATGGRPIVSFRGTAECRIHAGTSAPLINTEDYQTLRNAKIPFDAGVLLGDVSIWARSNGTESIDIEVLDGGGANAPAARIITGAGGWTVPLAGFANPKYFATNVDDATGFDISGSMGYTVAFENGATMSCTHEQTLDAAGLTGWFTVVGKGASSTSAGLSSSFSTSGAAQVFPSIGVRARIRVTALSVADAKARIALTNDIVDLATASGTAGASAEDGTQSGNPVTIAIEARNANKTAMSTNADVVRPVGTMIGVLVSRPNAIPEAEWSYAAAASGIVNTTTAVTIKAAAGAGIRNYLKSLQVSHDALGGAAELVVRDGAAGTVIYRTKLQTTAKEDTLIIFDDPLKSTANTLLEIAVLTAVTGGVYVNAQGYIAP